MLENGLHVREWPVFFSLPFVPPPFLISTERLIRMYQYIHSSHTIFNDWLEGSADFCDTDPIIKAKILQ